MRPIGKSCHRKGGLLGRFWNGSAADCCRATVSETNPSLFVHSNLSPFPLYLSSLGLSQICVNRAGCRVPIKDSRLSEFDILFGRGWNVILLRIAPHESNGRARTIVQRPKADRPFRCHVLTCISHPKTGSVSSSMTGWWADAVIPPVGQRNSESRHHQPDGDESRPHIAAFDQPLQGV